MGPGEIRHRSVLLKEAVELLAFSPGQIVVDGTLGSGGHAGRILECIGPEGRLIGFDKDSRALEEAEKALKPFGRRAITFCDSFTRIPSRLKELSLPGVDRVLLDLGISSFQLDAPERGFSFQSEGPLDMRMDRRQGETGADLVNRLREPELQDILWKYGEERFAGRIARSIVGERAKRPIRTTTELAAVIVKAVPPSYRHGRIHPATRSFQAFRIAVNHELEELEQFLSEVLSYLNPKGRVAVISFHSLEDRLVKRAFRAFQGENRGRVLTKKPVRPADEETASNPRSRSAKLRIFEKGDL